MENVAKISLIIDSKLELVSLLRSSLRAAIAECGVSEQDQIDIELAFGEAINNCIIHGLDEESGHDIFCELSVYPDELIIEIIDDGKTIPEDHRKKFDFSIDEIQDLLQGDVLSDLNTEIPTAGIGILLMKQCFTRFEYSVTGKKNKLKMIKELTKNTEERT